MSDITIRTSRSADETTLRRLAALDSQRLPAGELLVAETCGDIVAAYAPTADRAIADPFRHTADEVALLKLRAHGAPAAPVKARHGLFALPHTA